MLFGVGGILVASGFFHVLVWLLDGGSLAGTLSWRKPILFGVFAGIIKSPHETPMHAIQILPILAWLLRF